MKTRTKKKKVFPEGKFYEREFCLYIQGKKVILEEIKFSYN